MKRRLSLLALLILLLSGCGKQAAPECLIYYRAADGSGASSAAVIGQECGISVHRAEIAAALELLLENPGDVTLRSPFPAGTKVNSWTLEDGRLTVDFSEQYGRLYGVDLTLADYCVTLTMTQFEAVEEVALTVAGEEVPGRNQQVFRAGDVLLSGDEAQQMVLDVQLYFPLADGGGLGTEYREVRVGEEETPAEAVLQALCDGPTSKKMSAFLPEELGEVRIWKEETTCTVELDETWRSAMPANRRSLELTVYAMVNSLAELDDVEQVTLLAEGNPLWGEGPLKPDYQLSIRFPESSG